MKKFLIPTLVVLSFFGGYLAGTSALNSFNVAEIEKAPQTQISIMIDDGAGNIQVFNEPFSTSSPNLFNLMQNLASKSAIKMTYKNYEGLGSLIQSLNGLENGSGGKYWQYWVNNQYGKVGAGNYKPSAGDSIEWKFIKQTNF